MGAYIAKRILYAIPVLFFVTLIVFSLINLVPGDPIRLMYGLEATEAKVAIARARFHLDEPVIVRYFLWMKDVLRGDFGISLRSNQPVLNLIVDKLKNTVILTFASLTISVSISIILGVIAAYKRNTLIDFGVMGFAVVGISVPMFWSGLIAILIFAILLKVFPSMGYVSFLEDPVGFIKHLILPAGVLGFTLAGYTTRMTRSQMVDVLNQDYIRTARAKGVIERLVIYRHALKNALIPVVTAVGLQLGILMGGQILVEEIFAWPGVGRLAIKAIFNRDYPVVQGVVLVIAVLFVFINLAVDIIYAFLNPKIRYK